MVATQFDLYQQRRQTLLDTLEQQAHLLSALNMETWANKITRVRQRTAEDTFKVMVVGEFNRGKSTFINALLGQKILPAYAVPTTAIINELHYGPAPKAYLYHIVPEGSPPQRQEIPVADLQRYVVASEADGGRGKPYEKVALIWPLDLCRDGVELIDAPGLNADPTHQRITMDYLTRSDAVIFTIACDFPLSTSERDMIRSIHALHHDDIFFVCNRINMIDSDETGPVRQRLLRLLAPETRLGARRIYFIDAKTALDDRMRHDESQLAATGVPAVEDDLKDFLATDRGRLKLARPAQEAQEATQEARKTIRATELLLRSDLDALQRRYEQAREPLRQLGQERQNIGLNIQSFSRLLHIDATDEANR
ncbi:MAG TPA: dynamin family protein, partial [Ktedonobacterales bacterium]|nr:dynamin family protein [Ktedonobacterales bacterium]